MLPYPNIDPVLIELGPFQLRWYSVMYIIGLVTVYYFSRHASRKGALKLNFQEIESVMLYGLIGMIIGARLTYVIVYSSGHYLLHPLEIFATWKGGLSFHGAILGISAAIWIYARRHNKSFLNITDHLCAVAPVGLGFGRIGNFINAELPGRAANPALPWAMVWPNIDPIPLPRHPSPLYQAAIDGVLLFIILWLYARKPRPYMAVSGVFAAGYGIARFFTEYFRMPDYEVSIAGWTISAGQMLSLPMIVLGIVLLVIAYKKKSEPLS